MGDVTGTITRKASGKSENVTIKNGTGTFQLADGDTLNFNSLPVGTTYEVLEHGVEDGYIPSVQVMENGTPTTNNTGNDKDDLSSKNNGNMNLVGEKENKVTFTNTYKDIAITGIVMNNLPFILLAGIAVIAFGALAIMKKHRASR